MLSVWSVKALQAWAEAVLAVLGAQLCFPTSGLPWGPLCYSGPEMMLGCVRAPVPSAPVCLASALSLGVNMLPLTYHMLQDVLGNILLKSFFFHTEMSLLLNSAVSADETWFQNASLALTPLKHSALSVFCFAVV